MSFLNRMFKLFEKTDVAPAVRPGRNESCWCGSGMKYKKCHLPEDEQRDAARSEAACARNCGPT